LLEGSSSPLLLLLLLACGLKFKFENQDTRHVIAGILKDATRHPYKAREFVAGRRGVVS
jgi:hypothetical protein